MSTDLNEKLLLACSAGDTESARTLLALGADVNARDNASPYRHTPLMMSVRSGHLNTAQYLVESKADLSIQSTRGYTALIEAAWFGREEILKMLIEAGAEIDAVNYDGNTALMEAALMGHAGIVKALLDAGAHPDRMNKEGKTALDLARKDVIKALIKDRMSIISRIAVTFRKLSRRP